MYSTPFLLHELDWLSLSFRNHDLEPTLQRLFLDTFLDDYLENSRRISQLICYNISYSLLQFLLKRYNLVDASFSFGTRLLFFRIVASQSIWETQEILGLFLEARYLHTQPEILAFSRSIDGASIFHSLAAGMAGNFLKKSHHSVPNKWTESRQLWNRLLHESIMLDRSSLHHIDMAIGWSGNEPVSSPLCVLISSGIVSDSSNLSTTDDVCKSVTTLSEWIAILSSSDVDLLAYGHKERHMYEQGLTNVRQRWAHRRRNSSPARCSLIGITYGSCPKHWMLWWTNEYEDYAGEFWTMTEDEARKVPGAWVEDSWHPIEFESEEYDRLKAWKREQPTALIWSEYRRVRPPI